MYLVQWKLGLFVFKDRNRNVSMIRITRALVHLLDFSATRRTDFELDSRDAIASPSLPRPRLNYSYT